MEKALLDICEVRVKLGARKPWLLRPSDHQGPVEAGSPQLFTEDPGQPVSEPRQRLAVEGLEDVLSLLNPTFVGHPSCIPLPPKIRDNIVRG